MQNNLELAQKQSLSQTQIQSLEIMNLCNQDLYTFLNEEYMENPLMDKTGKVHRGKYRSLMNGICMGRHSMKDMDRKIKKREEGKSSGKTGGH